MFTQDIIKLVQVSPLAARAAPAPWPHSPPNKSGPDSGNCPDGLWHLGRGANGGGAAGKERARRGEQAPRPPLRARLAWEARRSSSRGGREAPAGPNPAAPRSPGPVRGTGRFVVFRGGRTKSQRSRWLPLAFEASQPAPQPGGQGKARESRPAPAPAEPAIQSGADGRGLPSRAEDVLCISKGHRGIRHVRGARGKNRPADSRETKAGSLA